MTRLSFLFLFLLALSGPALAGPEEAVAIMRLVASQEARIHRTAGAPGACIMRETFAASAFAMPGLRWMRPSPPPSVALTDDAPLPAVEAQALSDEAAAIVRGEARARIVARVDLAWMPGFAFCAAVRAGPILGFSAPAIGGGVAFVETGFTCGGLCGDGLLYALRRGPRGWAIVAVARTWIS